MAPFRVTFEFVQKQGTFHKEVFWARSARMARAMAHAGCGPNFILIHNVEPVIESL